MGGSLAKSYGNTLASGVIENISFTEIKTDRDFQDLSDNLHYPVYMKMIATGAMPNNSTSPVVHGISNFKRLARYEGAIYNSTNGITHLLPNEYLEIDVWLDTTNIYFKTITDRTAYDEGFVILYYTKTDTGTALPRRTQLLGAVSNYHQLILDGSMSDNQTVTADTLTTVDIDTAPINVDDQFDTSTSIFTSDKKQTVRIEGKRNLYTTSSGERYFRVVDGGAVNVIEFADTNSGSCAGTESVICELEADDTLIVKAQIPTTTLYTGNGIKIWRLK